MPISLVELRAVCMEHAMDIRDSQTDMDAPIFVEEVIEDADKIFLYITKGKKPKPMEVSANKNIKEK